MYPKLWSDGASMKIAVSKPAGPFEFMAMDMFGPQQKKMNWNQS